MGKGHQSAIGTLVEHNTRTIILVPLSEQAGFLKNAGRKTVSSRFFKINKHSLKREKEFPTI
ncbi:MAG TPA: hypothetical protein VNJ07_01695 [Chitinophagales bacterium]|nr:hypothetical protein [Chitinophagales bacterium]